MANQADLPVRTMCRVLGVSASGFYAWRDRAPSQRSIANAVMAERIRQIHQDSYESYGMPRVRAELIEQGVCISRQRVARLMREAGIHGISKRRGFTVTTRRDKRQAPAHDLVNRQFHATGPNQLWVADMTYVPTWTGFLYLAVVIDVWSRRVVGWAMGERMTANLVCDALKQAVLRQRPPSGVICHSDRGVQYACRGYRRLLKNLGFVQSMSRKGNCLDNACAECFFGTLKSECFYTSKFKDIDELKIVIEDYIRYYNTRRISLKFKGLSPVEYRLKSYPGRN